MSGFWDCPAELFVRFTVPGIESVITSHLEVFFRYVLDKQGNEVHDGNGFFHVGIVLMPVVVEGHVFPIIGINARGGDNRTSEVAADIFYDRAGVTEIGLGIDIETIFIFFVDGSFYFFEGRTDMGLHFIQKGSLESLAEVGIVKMFYHPPETVIGKSALGKETMDMGIPFQRPAEGMEDTDETGDKVSAFIHFMEHSENDTANRLEKTVKERAVIQKERAQIFINGKNEVPVGTVNEFEGHFRRAVNAVFVTAGGAELGMAAERDKFEFAAVGTSIHGTAIRRISAVNHLLNVIHNNRTGMKNILNFFVVFFKDLL